MVYLISSVSHMLLKNGRKGQKQRKYSNALINLQALAKTVFSKASVHDWHLKPIFRLKEKENRERIWGSSQH